MHAYECDEKKKGGDIWTWDVAEMSDQSCM